MQQKYHLTERNYRVIKTGLFEKNNENTNVPLKVPQSSQFCTLQTTSVFSTNSVCDSYLLKHRAVILVSPDENLCDGADGLHEKVSVVVGNCGVFGEDMVHVPACNSTKYVDTFYYPGTIINLTGEICDGETGEQ